jgi:hypothetical protein
MKIRRIQYNIYYTHILTFKEDYKKLASPFFAYDNVQYAIENAGTLNEGIRLIFNDFFSLIQFRKDGISIVCEGDFAQLSGNGEGIIHEFFSLYEHTSKLECFGKTIKHELIVRSVDIKEVIDISKYLPINPVKEPLIDFACVYHFNYKDYETYVTTGNFVQTDITRYELSLFNTERNKDLKDAENGKMIEVKISSSETSPDISKFNLLAGSAEHWLKNF